MSMGGGIKYGEVGTEDEKGSGDGGLRVGWRSRREEKRQRTCQGLARMGWSGSLTLVLVRLALALALAQRGGLTASAIDPAMATSALVFVKTLRFPQPAQFRPPGCHVIESPPLPGEGRQLGASTGSKVGQTTPGALFTGGWWPRPLTSRPHPLTPASAPGSGHARQWLGVVLGPGVTSRTEITSFSLAPPSRTRSRLRELSHTSPTLT